MRPRWCFLASIILAAGGVSHWPAVAADPTAVAAITAAADAFVKDFNAGKAEAVAAHFVPQGELIDEAGRVYQGQQELQDLFRQYFDRFPGATLELSIDSVRPLGDSLAIQEGTRRLTSKEGAQARVRHITVIAKVDGQWRIASTRELKDEPPPAPGDRLAPLAWLVGDWTSEGPDLAVQISYRWDEDGNFLIGQFRSFRNGTPVLKSSQRIGWDPRTGQIRSWLFDADGGFAEGTWTLVGDAWVIKSEAVLPEGLVGSATLTLTPKNKNQFLMRGTERIVGDSREDDFELTITRAPPKVRTVPAGGAAAPAAEKAAPVVPASPDPALPRPAAPRR